MSTGSRSDREPGPLSRSVLTVPLEVAIAALDERVLVGDGLLREIRVARNAAADKSFDSGPELRRLTHETAVWRDGNQTWLDDHLGGTVAAGYRSGEQQSPMTATDVALSALPLGVIPRGIRLTRRGRFDSLRSEVMWEMGRLESVRERLPTWDGGAAPAAVAVASAAGGDVAGEAPVFIVHGRDTLRAESVARAVEKATGRQAIILREMPNQGRTLIEKFEHNAGAASYAVVVLTADDEGGRRGAAEGKLRGRQNVVFKMGYFFGCLGRGRVSVLLDPDVEKPSDMDGVAYIPFDDEGAWKSVLFREMHAAGFGIDLSRT